MAPSLIKYAYAPEGIGEDAENICDPTGVVNFMEVPDGNALGQGLSESIQSIYSNQLALNSAHTVRLFI